MPGLPCLRCYIPGIAGLAAGQRLATELSARPWLAPNGSPQQKCRIFVPESLAGDLDRIPRDSIFCLCENLVQEARANFEKSAGIIFIGACGIAVRCVAPCLKHKSVDPPVVVIDPQCRHVISLLSGHWGGGNSLALHLAALLKAEPIITSQSDVCHTGALDVFLQAQGMKILDWPLLPKAQAQIARGKVLPLHDPLHLLPECSFLRPTSADNSEIEPTVSIDARKQAARPGRLRIAPGVLHLGIGCRLHARAEQLAQGLGEFLELRGLEEQAIGTIATVRGKGAQLAPLAKQLGASLLEFEPAELARVRTPHPSSACGARFGQAPFSVCEGAALLSAAKAGKGPALVAEKFVWNGLATFAIAAAGPSGLASRIKESLA